MRIFAEIRRPMELARISRIPVRAGRGWFFVLALMTGITAASIQGEVGNWVASLVLGAATTLVFFASIFIHELAHALIARVERLEVVEIVLHPFGGLTRFVHEPQTPRAEFRIAVAGPAASFLLAVIFALLMTAAQAGDLDILRDLFFLLSLANFLLAVFNLFPGYPLDGGRVLRAYLWRSGRDLNEATILTGRCGQVIAIGLVALGLFFAVGRGQFFTGFWAMLTGFFLFDSAKGIIAAVHAQGRTLVDDVMRLPIAAVPNTSVQSFVDGLLPFNHQLAYPVAIDRKLHGVLLLEDLKRLPRDEWRTTSIKDVMKPVTAEMFVETGTLLADARELVRNNNVGAVGVVDPEGMLVGFLTR
ncbi:MAG TPA: site-2 protease family protein [Pyrinomonadaceae bacterium]|nr:site-2 protease family protein [Pyrinomonadaceae bacterium]